MKLLLRTLDLKPKMEEALCAQQLYEKQSGHKDNLWFWELTQDSTNHLLGQYMLDDWVGGHLHASWHARDFLNGPFSDDVIRFHRGSGLGSACGFIIERRKESANLSVLGGPWLIVTACQATCYHWQSLLSAHKGRPSFISLTFTSWLDFKSLNRNTSRRFQKYPSNITMWQLPSGPNGLHNDFTPHLVGGESGKSTSLYFYLMPLRCW